MSQKQSIKNGQHVEQTEVAPKAKRRQYTNEYKLRILDEIDHSTDPAGIGSILRRERAVLADHQQMATTAGQMANWMRNDPEHRGPQASTRS